MFIITDNVNITSLVFLFISLFQIMFGVYIWIDPLEALEMDNKDIVGISSFCSSLMMQKGLITGLESILVIPQRTTCRDTMIIILFEILCNLIFLIASVYRGVNSTIVNISSSIFLIVFLILLYMTHQKMNRINTFGSPLI
jgi:hypothetical protein